MQLCKDFLAIRKILPPNGSQLIRDTILNPVKATLVPNVSTVMPSIDGVGRFAPDGQVAVAVQLMPRE